MPKYFKSDEDWIDVSISSNYTVKRTDNVIFIDTSGGNVTLTLNPSIIGKRWVYVKKTSVDNNEIILTPSSCSR